MAFTFGVMLGDVLVCIRLTLGDMINEFVRNIACINIKPTAIIVMDFKVNLGVSIVIQFSFNQQESKKSTRCWVEVRVAQFASGLARVYQNVEIQRPEKEQKESKTPSCVLE